MSEQATAYNLGASVVPNDRVRVPSHPEFGIGEVLRVAETAGFIWPIWFLTRRTVVGWKPFRLNCWRKPATYGSG